MTAAGTIPAAKILVIGAGVAGLQAIATAKRLGAIVSATDVRSASKEQVESLGGKFLTVEQAEEYGITSANADSMKTSDNPQIKRLVGAEGEMGAAFGLDNEWNLRIIKQVGNYGESYKRNIADTGILPDRGPNELWTKGGDRKSVV